MITYRDRTFCINPNCTCDRSIRYTDEVYKDACRWWAECNGKGEPPIAVGFRCGKQPTMEELEQTFKDLMGGRTK